MISAATGAVALVVAPLAKSHGLGYLVAAVILGGLFQVVMGLLGVANLMRFIPRSVMVGFVNALAILIFLAQVPQLKNVPVAVYPLVALALALIVLLPRLTKAVPAPLIAIAVLTVLTTAASIAVPTVGDQGKLPRLPADAGPAPHPVYVRDVGAHRAVRPGAGAGRVDGVADDRPPGRRHR